MAGKGEEYKLGRGERERKLDESCENWKEFMEKSMCSSWEEKSIVMEYGKKGKYCEEPKSKVESNRNEVLMGPCDKKYCTILEEKAKFRRKARPKYYLEERIPES